jgi:hypothetical protein
MKRRYLDVFEWRIAGIPCQIGVTAIHAGDPGNRCGHPDTWLPYEPPSIDFDILDRNGRVAFWLRRKMTDEDREDVQRHYCDRSEEDDIF